MPCGFLFKVHSSMCNVYGWSNFVFYQQEQRGAKDDSKNICNEVIDIKCAEGEIELYDFGDDCEYNSDEEE